jgi:hypothetical protein
MSKGNKDDLPKDRMMEDSFTVIHKIDNLWEKRVKECIF